MTDSTSTASKDGIILGTSRDDVIDLAYTGDPQGDQIDNNDGTNGTTGNEDLVYAGAGNDTVQAGDANDVVYGGDGNDVLYGGDGNDTLYGDGPNGGATSGGDGGSGKISGSGKTADHDKTGDEKGHGDGGGDDGHGDGHDSGDHSGGGSGSGNDSGAKDGGTHHSTAAGHDDTINGGNGDDTIYGGQGNDTLSGGNGEDIVIGGSGDDVVNGNAGDDILFGDGANTPADAPNLIVNGSFEDVSGLTQTTFGYLGVGSVSGWTTDDPTHEIDIHGNNRGGVVPADGHYWADLEATPGNIVLGQDVAGVTDGDNYVLTFSAGDRITDDNTFKVMWNGETVDVKGDAILDPVNGDMQRYSVNLTGGSGDGSNRIEFMGLGDPNKRGVSIDDVRMTAVHADTVAGDDVINGGEGDDLIYAGNGADTVLGGDGNDVIYGDDSDNGTSSGGGSGKGSGDSKDSGKGSGDDPDKNGDAHGHGDDGGDDAHGDAHGHGHNGNSDDAAQGSGSGKNSGDDPDKNGDAHGHGDDGGDDAHGGGHGSGGGDGGSGGGSDSGPDACNLTEGQGANGDTIIGGAGNDTIFGMSGADYLSGGQGNDTIFGGSGNDHILGGEGNDTLSGGEGEDCIEGGAGNDIIDGGQGADHLSGGDDRDVFTGTSGDVIDGGAGGDDYDTLMVDNVDHIDYTSSDHEDGIVHFNDGTTLDFQEIENIVPCFTPGTLVLTSKGERPVETLHPGDKVVTRDNGVQEIRWIGAKVLNGRVLLENPHLRPVLIRRGALGRGLPERDMMVSPNHRMLVANDKTTLLFEEREVLVAAKHLVDGKGIQQVDSIGLSYVHMMFDNHEVVLGDGTWTESFQPGDYSLKGIGTAQRNEIFELFPELRKTHGRKTYVSARRSLKRKEARLLQ